MSNEKEVKSEKELFEKLKSACELSDAEMQNVTGGQYICRLCRVDEEGNCMWSPYSNVQTDPWIL